MFEIMPNSRRRTGGLLDSVFDDLRRDLWSGLKEPLFNTSSLVSSLTAPAVDITETDSDYIARLEIPGATSDDVDVEFIGDTLTVKLNRKDVKEGSNLFASRVENFTVQRTVKNVDADNISAEMKNGILVITLPKAEKSSIKKIAVKGE